MKNLLKNIIISFFLLFCSKFSERKPVNYTNIKSILQYIIYSNLLFRDVTSIDETLIFSDILPDGSNISVFRFGNQILIDEQNVTNAFNPITTGMGGGRFLTSFSAEIPFLDPDSTGVFGIEFDEFGNITTPIFLINQDTQGPQSLPNVNNIDLNRSFSSAWSSNDAIFGLNFEDPNTPIGNQFKISGEKTSLYPFSNTLSNSDIFTSFITNTSIEGIIYNSIQNIKKPLFDISDTSNFVLEEFPSISRVDNGNYVVTWSQILFESKFNVLAQFFSVDNVKIENNIILNSKITSLDLLNPQVIGLPKNIFFFGWVKSTDESLNIEGILYDSVGNSINGIFNINEISINPFITAVQPAASELSGSGISLWCWTNTQERISCQMFYANFTNLTKIGFEFLVTNPSFSRQTDVTVANITDNKFSLCFNNINLIACQLLRVEIRRPTLPPFGPSGGGDGNPTWYILMIVGIVLVILAVIKCCFFILCKKASVDADVDGNTVHFGLQKFDLK